MAPLLHHQTGN